MTKSRALGEAAVSASGFFVLRVPLLPRAEIDRLSDGLHAAQASDEELASALSHDRERVRDGLARWLKSSVVREALFVASPKLADQLDTWSSAPESERGRRIERTLIRYFARMSARPTPFGLFAGCAVGSVGPKTKLEIGGLHGWTKHSRLDMDYLSELAAKLNADPDIRRHLVYRPNSSLYEAGGRLRYAEARIEGKERSYGLVAVEVTDYLMDTLRRASDGATIDELAAALVDDEISRAEADEYIGALIDSQILVSDLAPEVTGREPLDNLIARVEATGVARGVAAVLDDVRAAVEKIDARGLGVERLEYDAIARRLEELPAQMEPARLFQVDMTRPGRDLAIGPIVIAELARTVEILRTLSGPVGREGLDRFRSEFTLRYEGRDVPLLEALDEEIGIGFERSDAPSADASPLLAGLHFPARSSEMKWTRQHAFLLTLFTRALQTAASEIELSDADVDALAADEPATLPEAFAVPSVIAATSANDIDRGRFQVWVNGVYGPSGARLLGRFCHADPDLHARVLEHLRAEEQLRREAVFAEIVHLPEGRVGNILLRPVLRDHEIPYLGRSGAPADKQIPVADLTVSVIGGRIVLRSRSLNKEVIPRLTSAHNYSWRSLGVYRFLCALQNQDKSGGIAWRWGPLENAPFLPRVRYRRSVLSRALWNVDAGELAPAIKAQGAARFGALQEWRGKRRLPRFVALADFDNELLLDLENVVFIDSFVHLVSRRRAIRLVESWPQPDELPVSGSEGRYVAELAVPFVAKEAAWRPALRAASSRDIARTFPPGSKWLYAKVYTGASTADRVLYEHIGPLVARLRADGSIDDWFFIRYPDPDWHLRVRLHSATPSGTGNAVQGLTATLGDLVDGGLAWKIQMDTYEREVERYGGPAALELAERVFAIDSDAVIEILPMLSGDEAADSRWRIALFGIHALLEDFGVPQAAGIEILKRYRDSLTDEFQADALLKRQLGQKHRTERASVEALIERGETDDPVVGAGRDALLERSQRIRSLASLYRELEAAGELVQGVDDIVMSFAHMHVNRLLRSTHRAQELVLYELLHRTYRAIAARR